MVARRGIWIPNQYASLCLEEETLPVDAWERLYGALRQGVTLGSCSPLVDYLRVQIRGNYESNKASYEADELVGPCTASSLVRHCTGNIQHMAPSDAEMAPSSPAPYAGEMTAEDWQALILSFISGLITTIPADSESTNTIGNRWSFKPSMLMKYTLSASEIELAPIFQAIASVSKMM